MRYRECPASWDSDSTSPLPVFERHAGGSVGHRGCHGLLYLLRGCTGQRSSALGHAHGVHQPRAPDRVSGGPCAGHLVAELFELVVLVHGPLVARGGDSIKSFFRNPNESKSRIGFRRLPGEGIDGRRGQSAEGKSPSARSRSRAAMVSCRLCSLHSELSAVTHCVVGLRQTRQSIVVVVFMVGISSERSNEIGCSRIRRIGSRGPKSGDTAPASEERAHPDRLPAKVRHDGVTVLRSSTLPMRWQARLGLRRSTDRKGCRPCYDALGLSDPSFTPEPAASTPGLLQGLGPSFPAA